jgi:hypothetical protein
MSMTGQTKDYRQVPWAATLPELEEQARKLLFEFAEPSTQLKV